MNDEEKMKGLTMVRMNEVEISTDENPIIGTKGLSTCIGFILYNDKYKRAIVGHVSCDGLMTDYGISKLQSKIVEIVCENQLINNTFDLKIIEGAYKSQYEVYAYQLDMLKDSYKFKYNLLEVLEEAIKRIQYININEINNCNFPINAFQIVDENGSFICDERSTLSKRFAFDASSGEFVTERVLFEDYGQFTI